MASSKPKIKNLARASALLSCAFPQGHINEEYTSDEVAEYLMSIPVHSTHDFFTSKEDMSEVFSDSQYRRKITKNSCSLISFKQRDKIYKVSFDQSLLNAKLPKGEMMQNVLVREVVITDINEKPEPKY